MEQGSPKHLHVQAVAFSELAQARPLDWEPPLRDLLKAPGPADFVWRRLQYVFPLPDPRSFNPPAVPLTTDERALLERFVRQAETLAGTSLLAAEDAVRISIPDIGDGEDVESELSYPDVTTGFMVLLRQCYADDEEASFSKVRKVVERRLHEAGDDESLAVLIQWRKTHARLKNQTLEELVQEQLIVDGKMPETMVGPDGEPHSSVVRAPAAPSELLLTFWYGGQIHWGKNSSELSAIQADPFWEAMWEIAARQAAVDLAHFYLGVAVLVQQVLASAQHA